MLDHFPPIFLSDDVQTPVNGIEAQLKQKPARIQMTHQGDPFQACDPLSVADDVTRPHLDRGKDGIGPTQVAHTCMQYACIIEV